MKKDRRFRQGIFKPNNNAKYLGGKNPVYRSSWELKFFRWADMNENVLAWGSENIVIPYVSPLDKRVHRYFVDNFIVFKDNEGNKKKFLIEIKPSKQVAKPDNSNPNRRGLLYEQKTWIINQAKWDSARKWAKDKNCEFLILTERELGL